MKQIRIKIEKCEDCPLAEKEEGKFKAIFYCKAWNKVGLEAQLINRHVNPFYEKACKLETIIFELREEEDKK